MSFSANIAKKYIFAQRRHSALTVFSIAAAVALITVLFTIYSSLFASALAFKLKNDPWHIEVNGLTKEQAEAFVSTGDFEDHKFREQEFVIEYSDGTSETVTDTFLQLRFKKDIEDCDIAMEKAANAAGFSYAGINLPYPYALNEHLLQLENIGDAAKGKNVQMFAFFYVLILVIILCSRLVIDTAFEISSKEREKQFGVLQSIGASKKQITAIMTWEGGFLSLAGIPLGLLFGLGASYLLFIGVSSSEAMKSLAESRANLELEFSVSPLFLLVVAVTGLVWVLLSAYGTGMRAAKVSPVEAIRSRGAAVKKVKRRSVFALLFGWTGKLAARNIRRGKKRFVITALSVMLSMVLFVSFVYAIDILVNMAEKECDEYEHDFGIHEIHSSTDVQGSAKMSYRELNTLLNESGYFDNVICAPKTEVYADVDSLSINDKLAEFYDEHNVDQAWLEIRFVDETLYKKIMGNDPQVPYSQLSQQNGYVLLNATRIINYSNYDDHDTEKAFNAFNISRGETITVKKEYSVHLDKPITVEYKDENGDSRIKVEHEQIKTDDIEIKILDISQESNGIIDSSADSIYLIGTFDQYDKYFFPYDVIEYDFKSLADSTWYMIVTADLKDGADYDKAMDFLNEHNLETWDNVYELRLTAYNMVAMVKMIGYTLLALVSLIAVINLVNVISTGIINRRPEIASMKSLGMSRGQLVKMILIECGQYAVVSGVIAIVVSELLFYLTMQSMNLFKMSEQEIAVYIDYSKPVGYVLIAMAAAFICSVAATILPLRRIEKSSITDEIKRID